MINNLLKVVGVDSKDSTQSSPYSPGSNADYNSAYGSNHHGAPSSSSTISPGENLASTLGGFLNNFQETFQLDGKAVVAGALDSTGAMGVMNHKSWNKSSGSGSSGAGRYKNVGGRVYYTDGSASGSRRDAGGSSSGDAQQQRQRQGGSGSSSSSRGQKQRGGKSSSHHKTNPSMQDNNGMYQGRKMVSDISHLYHVVDDKQAYENYDTLMEITANASAQANERLADGGNSDSSSSVSSSRRGRNRRANNRESSQEQKQNWARAKEEELVDRMLSQFPVRFVDMRCAHLSELNFIRCEHQHHLKTESSVHLFQVSFACVV